jgi:hypothetical protein
MTKTGASPYISIPVKSYTNKIYKKYSKITWKGMIKSKLLYIGGARSFPPIQSTAARDHSG